MPKELRPWNVKPGDLIVVEDHTDLHHIYSCMMQVIDTPYKGKGWISGKTRYTIHVRHLPEKCGRRAFSNHRFCYWQTKHDLTYYSDDRVRLYRGLV